MSEKLFKRVTCDVCLSASYEVDGNGVIDRNKYSHLFNAQNDFLWTILDDGIAVCPRCRNTIYLALTLGIVATDNPERWQREVEW